MKKKELFERLKDVPDDFDILVFDTASNFRYDFDFGFDLTKNIYTIWVKK